MYKALLSSVILFVSLHANAELLLTAKEDILIKPKTTTTDIGGNCTMTHESSSLPRKLRMDSVITVTRAENISPVLRDYAVDTYGISLEKASEIQSYDQLKQVVAEIGGVVPSAEELFNKHYDFEKVVSVVIKMFGGKYTAGEIKNFKELNGKLNDLGANITSVDDFASYKKLFLVGKSEKSSKLIQIQCLLTHASIEKALVNMNNDSKLQVTNTPDDL